MFSGFSGLRHDAFFMRSKRDKASFAGSILQHDQCKASQLPVDWSNYALSNFTKNWEKLDKSVVISEAISHMLR